MFIKTISWEPFRLPFAGAFGTARANLAVREGCIIRLETDNGLIGLGEASPLPEFGGGTLADVLRLLEKWWPRLIGGPVANTLDMIRVQGPGANAFLCGLDTALCDVLAQSEGLRLAEWLGGFAPARMKDADSGAGISSPLIPHPSSFTGVPVNATIGAPGNARAVALAQKAVAEGFECVKLKVGLAADISGEVARVGAVRAAIGDEIKLRLDANGGWTVGQAIATLHKLEHFNLELVEQPVAAHNLAGMAQVRKMVDISLAADEAVTDEASARAVIEAGAADILVIKPMMVGGLRAGRKLIELAQSAGLRAFVTTTIDSGVGIATALHLAATLPEPRLACGLATASLLEGSLVKELPEIRNGRMYLPDKPGLGVDL
jgi:L-alanine-DL-glutamate epimerase-like enolase superfamily enzyme